MDKALADDLMRDEGVRLKPYYCDAGRLTIGVGRNLEDAGITTVEAMDMLGHDIDRVVDELNAALPWWLELPEPAQRGLANMCFNLGLSRLLKFKKMLLALETGDYEVAATEALDSLWACQVGTRADRIAELFRGRSL